MEIGPSSVNCVSGFFSTGGTTCTWCSGELLDDIVKSITPPLGTSRSTFGDAMYLYAKVGGFFLLGCLVCLKLAIFVNEESNFIILACSLSNVANGLSNFANAPPCFIASNFSVDVETGEISGLGNM